MNYKVVNTADFVGRGYNFFDSQNGFFFRGISEECSDGLLSGNDAAFEDKERNRNAYVTINSKAAKRSYNGCNDNCRGRDMP